MCRFYSFQIYDYLLKYGYKKMMRLDDDSYIVENMTKLFVLVTEDTPYICRLFQSEDVVYRKHVDYFVNIFTDRMNYDRIQEEQIAICPFNNFFLLDLSIYEREDVQKFLFFMDCVGGIYSHRWGDAVLQNILLRLLLPHSVYRMGFTYSKWGIVHDKEWDWDTQTGDSMIRLEEYFTDPQSLEKNEYIMFMTTFYSVCILFFVLLISWIRFY
jgi:hypothetical protein